MITTNHNIPPITKNLILINSILFLGRSVISYFNDIDINFIFGAFFPQSYLFRPWQIITYAFMHANVTHLFFNMFSLYFFGGVVEQILGARRYIWLYIFTALGGFLLYNITHYFEVYQIINNFSPKEISIIQDSLNHIKPLYGFVTENNDLKKLSFIYSTPMVGASGAIFGVMTAFAVLYPNVKMMLIFPPIPIKAKYFIPILILIEIFLNYMDFNWDNVAHMAHLGGGIIGIIMILYYKRKKSRIN